MSGNIRFSFKFLLLCSFYTTVITISFNRPNILKKGYRVVRGQHWEWLNQDGGKGSQGTIAEILAWKGEPESAVLVLWDVGTFNIYRAGAGNGTLWDIDVVSETEQPDLELPEVNYENLNHDRKVDPSTCPDTERRALLNFYSALGGSKWKYNRGWKEADMGDNSSPCELPWEGLRCKNGHIFSIKLDNNNLVGTIPSEFFESVTKMVSLDLSFNSISGSIPDTIGFESKLQHLELKHNELVGPIPSTVGNCKNMSWISLFDNKLSGLIPSQVGQLTKLEYLFLGRNRLDVYPPITKIPRAVITLPNLKPGHPQVQNNP